MSRRGEEYVENAYSYPTASRGATVAFVLVLIGWAVLMVLAATGWSP